MVIPVADADRSKAFYAGLGWRLDADFSFDNGFRVVQFTPPGSPCSIQFGTKITAADTRVGARPLPDRLRHRRRARRAHGARSQGERGVPRRSSRGRNSNPMIRVAASTAPIRTTRATTPLPRSRIPTATTGCCRKSPIACPAALIPTSLHSVPPATWRARCGAPKQPTASTKSASARPTPTGPTGTPRSWWRNKQERSFPHE